MNTEESPRLTRRLEEKAPTSWYPSFNVRFCTMSASSLGYVDSIPLDCGLMYRIFRQRQDRKVGHRSISSSDREEKRN